MIYKAFIHGILEYGIVLYGRVGGKESRSFISLQDRKVQ